MILVWLLEANYTLNILVFLYWWQIILGTEEHSVFSSLAARLRTHTLCSLNNLNNSLYNASYYMYRKITSHWPPLFSKKMAAAASFSYKIGGGASFSNKIGGGGKDLATLLAVVLTWS